MLRVTGEEERTSQVSTELGSFTTGNNLMDRCFLKYGLATSIGTTRCLGLRLTSAGLLQKVLQI